GGDGGAGGGEIDGTLELGADGDGVGAHDRHAHAGGGDLEVGQPHDLAAFLRHLGLLAGVAVGVEAVDLRDAVERDLIGINLGRDGPAGGVGLDLILEFTHGVGAGAGDGLIGGDDDALQAEGLVQGPEAHEHDGRGTVGVGDDAAVVAQLFRVDLGNDQRDVGLHAQRGALVDDNATGGDRVGRESAGDRAAGSEERQIHAGKNTGLGLLDDEGLAGEIDGLARRTRRGEKPQAGQGEVALVQKTDELLTDGTGGADDADNMGGIIHDGYSLGVV